jgi:preprotein translocase subunit SecF
MKAMNSRNTSMIATIVAAVLCGCPGLFGLCFGATSLFASFVPGAQIDVMGSNDPQAAMTMGLVTLCLSVIFLAVPVVVWFVTRRRETAGMSDHEPLPPVS